MNYYQRQMVALLAEQGEEAKLCVLLVALKLRQGQKWVEHFVILNRKYRIESFPDRREIVMRAFE